MVVNNTFYQFKLVYNEIDSLVFRKWSRLEIKKKRSAVYTFKIILTLFDGKMECTPCPHSYYSHFWLNLSQNICEYDCVQIAFRTGTRHSQLFLSIIDNYYFPKSASHPQTFKCLEIQSNLSRSTDTRFVSYKTITWNKVPSLERVSLGSKNINRLTLAGRMLPMDVLLTNLIGRTYSYILKYDGKNLSLVFFKLVHLLINLTHNLN